uniref:Uncharacterized protein n=1 Tax=Strongyloides stercoralis TaxID=6248 RepID=A0A0K0E6T8_STRER
MVIVKCPDRQYRHIKATDHFSLYGSQRERNLFHHTDDEVFAWTPFEKPDGDNRLEVKDDGAIKNSLKRVKDFVFMVDAKEDKVTLDCSYITPNGNVALVKTFLKGKKVFIGLNDKGEEIYAVKSNDDKSNDQEKNKELEVQNKSLLSKLKSKIGPIGAYAVIIIIALVAFTIILVVGILLYNKFLKEWVVKKGLFKKNKDKPKVAGKKKSVN